MSFDWRGFFFGGAGQAPDPQTAQFQDRDYLLKTAQQGIANATNRQAPQAAGTRVGQVAQYGGPRDVRAQEMQLAGQLGRVASGQQMGAGELAARRAGQQAIGNAIGSANMARGANAAGGARAAARAAAGIGLGVAGQAQQAGLQDAAAARAQQAGVLGQVGARDTQIGLQNMDATNQRVFQQAGLDQATSLANMQARLQAIGMNDQAILGYMSQISGMDAATLQARMQQEQQQLGSTGVAPYLLQAGGSAAMAAMSDERLKRDIEPAQADVHALLEALRPVTWHYLDPVRYGAGRHVGVIAQDLQRTPLGAELVCEGPTGHLMIDTVRAVNMLLAAVADLHGRVKQLEDELGVNEPMAPLPDLEATVDMTGPE